LSPLLLLVPELELVSASTTVVIVTTPPSERVETRREMREAEISLVVEVVNSEVVKVAVEVGWAVVEGDEEELEKD
jgi:hypothetical protein